MLVGVLLTGLLSGGPLGAQEPPAPAAARSAGVLAGRVNGGTVFYIGYDDHYQQEDLIEDFEEQRFGSRRYRRTNRALFTKFQILFRP